MSGRRSYAGAPQPADGGHTSAAGEAALDEPHAWFREAARRSEVPLGDSIDVKFKSLRTTLEYWKDGCCLHSGGGGASGCCNVLFAHCNGGCTGPLPTFLHGRLGRVQFLHLVCVKHI